MQSVKALLESIDHAWGHYEAQRGQLRSVLKRDKEVQLYQDGNEENKEQDNVLQIIEDNNSPDEGAKDGGGDSASNTGAATPDNGIKAEKTSSSAKDEDSAPSTGPPIFKMYNATLTEATRLASKALFVFQGEVQTAQSLVEGLSHKEAQHGAVMLWQRR
ncbi:unnamed protein product [Amoebophrya sp. A120]|nr:unnamed protein product [Amoebophrya sp. A120]|eukprot:GSA120T00020717001.1